MNIFLHELKVNRKSIISWIITLCCITVLFLWMFPVYSKEAESIKKLLESYPKAFLEAFGMNIDTIFSVLGFYSFVFLYILLCGAIQAMNMGLSMFGKEIKNKTADFLMTKPVTRPQIMTAKLGALGASLLLTNIIFIIVATISLNMVSTENYSMETYLLISFSLFFTQILFAAMGVLISVCLPKIKSIVGMSLGIVFGFYFIKILGDTVKGDKLAYLSPFGYFDSSKILIHNAYETKFVVFVAILTVAMIIGSYIIYNKKDIHAV